MPKSDSKRAETKNKKPLHYTACGLDDIYLMSGYEIVKTSHGEGSAITKLDELHLAIGRNLAERKKSAFCEGTPFPAKTHEPNAVGVGQASWPHIPTSCTMGKG